MVAPQPHEPPMSIETKPPAPAPGAASSLSPFRHTTFTVLWIATVIANIGTWMQNAAAGWLMTGLDPDPFTVSLVQVASSLPMFLFALAGGALADIVDRRRLLIVVQTTIAVLVAGFGLLVWLDHVTPAILLAFSFLAGTAAALIAPAWLSIIPQLVPRADLQPAVALNGVGINVSRAVGPALAGLIIVAWGLAAPRCRSKAFHLGATRTWSTQTFRRRATAPSNGAFTRTQRRRGGSWRPSSWIPGSSICTSTSGSQRPTAPGRRQ